MCLLITSLEHLYTTTSPTTTHGIKVCVHEVEKIACDVCLNVFAKWGIEQYVLFIKRAGVLYQHIKTRREAECFRC